MGTKGFTGGWANNQKGGCQKGGTQYKREAMVTLCCDVGIGQYVDISYIPIQRSFHYFDAIKWQETLFLH